MPREPNEKVIKAKDLFDQGQKMVDIATSLQVPEGTIRSWKKRYEWDATLQNGKRNVANVQNKKKTTKKAKEKALPEEVGSVIENPDLTDEQRLFCLYYNQSFNATRSYQKAYGCDYISASRSGPRLLKNVVVKKEVLKLKQERYVRSHISEEDVFQKYMDIAYSDITDYLEFGRRTVPVMGAFGPVMVNDDNGTEIALMKEINAVEFKESTEVDGSIISEVKQGKDGASIKLADRMKALQWLSDHMDLATVEQNARINKLKAETVLKDDKEAKTEQSIKIYIPDNGR